MTDANKITQPEYFPLTTYRCSFEQKLHNFCCYNETNTEAEISSCRSPPFY